MLAAFAGHADVVLLLLEAGADPDAQDKVGGLLPSAPIGAWWGRA